MYAAISTSRSLEVNLLQSGLDLRLGPRFTFQRDNDPSYLKDLARICQKEWAEMSRKQVCQAHRFFPKMESLPKVHQPSIRLRVFSLCHYWLLCVDV